MVNPRSDCEGLLYLIMIKYEMADNRLDKAAQQD